jgi:hypothetical protein
MNSSFRRSCPAFSRHTLRKRFRTACKVLGAERLATLTIHHGRHTFISHALAGARTLAGVAEILWPTARTVGVHRRSPRVPAPSCGSFHAFFLTQVLSRRQSIGSVHDRFPH